MTVRNSLPTDLASGLPILDTRVALASLIVRDAAGNPRPGIFPGAPALLVTGTATMTYNIGVFGAATSRTAGGVELIGNDGTINRATSAAPSSNSRIDIIYLRPRFAGSGDGSSAPDVLVASGTAALNPTPPTIPAGSLELARATIPSGASGTNSAGVVITQTYQFTACAGGTVPVRNVTELNAWTPADSAQAWMIADGCFYERKAGGWRGGLVPFDDYPAKAGYTKDPASGLHLRGGMVSGQVRLAKNAGVWGHGESGITLPTYLRPLTETPIAATASGGSAAGPVGAIAKADGTLVVLSPAGSWSTVQFGANWATA